MSSPETVASYADLARSVTAVHESLNRLAGSEPIEAIPDQMVQALLTMGVQLYFAKRESGVDLCPLLLDELSATEVAVASADMVKAVQLELFEVALWNSWGRP